MVSDSARWLHAPYYHPYNSWQALGSHFLPFGSTGRFNSFPGRTQLTTSNQHELDLG